MDENENEKYKLIVSWILIIGLLATIGLVAWVITSVNNQGIWFKYGDIITTAMYLFGVGLYLISVIIRTVKYSMRKKQKIEKEEDIKCKKEL